MDTQTDRVFCVTGRENIHTLTLHLNPLKYSGYWAFTNFENNKLLDATLVCVLNVALTVSTFYFSRQN